MRLDKSAKGLRHLVRPIAKSTVDLIRIINEAGKDMPFYRPTARLHRAMKAGSNRYPNTRLSPSSTINKLTVDRIRRRLALPLDLMTGAIPGPGRGTEIVTLLALAFLSFSSYKMSANQTKTSAKKKLVLPTV